MARRYVEAVEADLVLRLLREKERPPEIPSEYDDWGPMDPESKVVHETSENYVLEIIARSGSNLALNGAGNGEQGEIIGFLSAQTSWNYGPTTGSKAINIGVSICAGARGRGIGSESQVRVD